MRLARDLVENERGTVSELAALSRDPALTFRPDPTFRAKFRNPDEIIEGDLKRTDTAARPYLTAPPSWTCAASWLRSPKE